MLRGKTAIITGASLWNRQNRSDRAWQRKNANWPYWRVQLNKLQEVVDEVHTVGGEAIAVACDLMIYPVAVETSLKSGIPTFRFPGCPY